jgi:pimeloyl-ACP methyl ester carboxylesterase
LFKRVVLVGHSYGSLILDVLAQYGPPAADVMVYTSYSRYIPVLANTGSGQVTAPARTVFPDRFGDLDEGYSTLANVATIRQSFYAANGTFDSKFPSIEFKTEDAQPVGEFNSIARLFGPGGTFQDVIADKYRGLLLWAAGQNDNVFCGGECGYGDDNIIRHNAKFYPNAKGLEFLFVNNTGHLINLHYSARKLFAGVEDWLERHGV